MDRYAYARARYAEIGVDTDAAIEHLAYCPRLSPLLAGRRCHRL